MLDRITDIFVDIDDFCKLFFSQCQEFMLSHNQSKPRGPKACLGESEIMTIVILYHRSNFQHFKNFYCGVVSELLHKHFPNLPSYQRFIELLPRSIFTLTIYLNCKMGKQTGVYYVDSTALPVCHNLRINRHKVFDGFAARGKSSTGWFFGLKLHLIFNDQNEIVAAKLSPGNYSDISALPVLTKGLTGKLFGDKGYLGQKMAQELLENGLAIMTKVRRNMKSLPMHFIDKLLLNKRNIAESNIGLIKEFSSLNLSRNRSPINAMIHIIAALIAYQLYITFNSYPFIYMT